MKPTDKNNGLGHTIRVDDDINVPIRLDDDVLLKLAKIAHASDVTMNDLCLAIMSDFIAQRRATAGSRNRREGYYAGYWAAGSAPPYGKRRHRRVRPDGMFISLREYGKSA